MRRLSRLVLAGAVAGTALLVSPADATRDWPDCVQEPCYDCVMYPCYPSDYVEFAICSTIGCPPPA